LAFHVSLRSAWRFFLGLGGRSVRGGNAELIEPPLPANVKIVSNTAGMTGGVRLWDERMDHAFAELNLPAFSVPRN
jgi:hypothetical protein